jgi:hypothetical protein
MNNPQMEASDLREARAELLACWKRACWPRRLPACAWDGGLWEQSAALVGPSPTFQAEEWERATRGDRIWLQRPERTSGKGDHDGGNGSMVIIAMVTGTFSNYCWVYMFNFINYTTLNYIFFYQIGRVVLLPLSIIHGLPC